MGTREEKKAKISADAKRLNENIEKQNTYGSYFNKTVAEILNDSMVDDFDDNLEAMKAHYILTIFYDNQPDYIAELFDWKREDHKLNFYYSNSDNYWDLELDLNNVSYTCDLIKEMEEFFEDVGKCFELVKNEYQIKVA